MAEPDTFPRQYARTRRFSLGEPRAFRIAPDGTRIAFLRSRGGSDAVTCLWTLDRSTDGTWTERLVCDPKAIGASDGDVPPAERARRERLREQADGITSFDTDTEVTSAVFALGGNIAVASLLDGSVQVLAAAPGAYDPRLAPDGLTVAYVADRGLHVIAADGSGDDRLVVREDDASITWATADFNAAEEFSRQRGFWWSPDSRWIVAERVDETPVRRWFIADPANPSREPSMHRYPAAGTANAIVSLSVFDVFTAQRVDVAADNENVPYLVDVRWHNTRVAATWMTRDQTTQRLVAIDPTTGEQTVLDTRSATPWIELTPGTPCFTSTGLVDPEPFLPEGLLLRRIVSCTDAELVAVVGAASDIDRLAVVDDPSQQHVVRIGLADRRAELIAGGHADPGVHDATATGDVVVVRSASMGRARAEFRVIVHNTVEHRITNVAEAALVTPDPFFFRVGAERFPCCVLLPTDPVLRNAESLPVLMDPYGGPHAQRVVASRNAHATSQWFADQGFAVVVVDGRGTPGLGAKFEYGVYGNLADPVLDDQIAGLLAAAQWFPQMDLTRVGIRGWSFGGYLAALAVMKRPDVFHAAIAGAPVTEWRLYDTGYTERYLGNPANDPAPYDRSSLLPLAPQLSRPLMLIHGLADDNVVAAHTLQLSSALLAAGRPHEVLPLSGVTHMTPQEVVAENLLKLQIDFLRRSLG